MPTNSETSIAKLIFIPAVITLAITLLRLVGELQHWPTSLFNPAAGGGGALIGISWLPPILGVYFALKLVGAGEVPETSAGRVILFALLGVVLMVAGVVGVGRGANGGSPLWLAGGLILIVVAMAIQFSTWRKLFKVLLAYAFAARIPVAILMFFAIKGNWGTHYDVAPPNFPDMEWLKKYLLIGFVPQMFMWIPFTVLTGTLTAGVTALIAGRRKAVTAGA